MYKLFLSARSKSGSNDEEEVACNKNSDNYSENGIPFAVTVRSTLWGDDECSALEEDEGEFERLWAQLDLQHQQQQQQQQQQPQIQPLYGLPPWMVPQQQQPRQLFPSVLPQPQSLAAAAHPISDEEEEEEEEEEEKDKNHNIRNSNSAVILSELAAMERSVHLHLKRVTTDKTKKPKPSAAGEELECWSLGDAESEMETYLIPEETSFLTPVDTDRKELSSSQERSLGTPTLYDRGGDMDIRRNPTPTTVHGMDVDTCSAVPTEITPPPLPHRPTTVTPAAATPNHTLVRRGPITPRPSTTTTSASATTRPVRNLTTTTTHHPSNQGTHHHDDNRLSCHWSERAKCITATITKPSKQTRLGLDLRTTLQGAVEINDISKDGFVFVSGVPLQVGDVILGITTGGMGGTTNHTTRGMRKQDILRLLQRTVGPMTLVALNPTGNPARVESMTVKPHPDYGTGIFFASGAAGLRIHSVPSNGLFAQSLLSAGDQVLSINGIDCSLVDASVATDMVKSAPRFVSIVTQPTANGEGVATTAARGHSVLLEPTNHPVAREQPNNLTTVPEGGERRLSFGMFRRRSPS